MSRRYPPPPPLPLPPSKQPPLGELFVLHVLPQLLETRLSLRRYESGFKTFTYVAPFCRQNEEQGQTDQWESPHELPSFTLALYVCVPNATHDRAVVDAAGSGLVSMDRPVSWCLFGQCKQKCSCAACFFVSGQHEMSVGGRT